MMSESYYFRKIATFTAIAFLALQAVSLHLFSQTTCTPDGTTLCLQNGRFEVTLTYVDGGTNNGNAVALSNESGTFWFFNSQNAEVLVKVLDGTSINDHYWLYHSAMTSLAYTLTVSDLTTGITKTYSKPAGEFCGHGDTTTFAESTSAPKRETTEAEKAELFAQLAAFQSSQAKDGGLADVLISAQKAASCAPSGSKICLQNSRFEVSVTYTDPDTGQTRTASAHPYSDESGFFSFFSSTNMEIGVKIHDAIQGYGYYWVFIGGATHVGYTVKVTDTLLGITKNYPTAGAFCGQADNTHFGNPELRLQQGGTVISRNGTINLGNTPYNQPFNKTFTIYNDGTAPLDILDLDWDGSDISLVTPPPGTIPKGGQGTFTLAFGAGTSGNLSREIRLTTTDLGPNPFRFNAAWTVEAAIGPVIRLKHDGSVVGQTQTVNFGNTGLNQPLSETFTAENIGDQPLTIAPISISSNAGDPGQFSVGHNNVVNIQPGQSATFSLDFNPAGLGSVTREIRLFVGGTPRFSFYAKATVLAPDYTLSIGPASRTIDPGQNAFYTVTVNALYGFSGTVTLSISGLPSGANPTFTPVNVSGAGTSQLKISTNAGTNPGNYPFTVTGTNGGTTRNTNASLIINDPADFTVSATPGQRTITQGASTTFGVTVNGTNGFNGPVTLTMTGLPPNTTQGFNPSTITPGQQSTLTLQTAANTPPNDYPITIRGTNGGRTRTTQVVLTVNEASAEAPEITGLNPDHVDGGLQTHITVTGRNLQNASVSIANQPAEPGDPIPTAFPGVSVVSINGAGTSMVINVDARNSQVSGFYTLVVTTPGGETGTVFRVVTNGPQVDAWSPSKPARGQVYQLLIMGLNMRHATVSSNNSGIEAYVVGTTDTHLNGFMFVADNAPLGNTTLTVRNNGVSVQLPIQVVATSSAQIGEHNLFAEHAERVAGTGETVPEVFLQDLTFNPELAASSSSSQKSSEKGLCFVTLGWSIYSYNYTVLLPFDPLTGKIDRNVLQGIGLGQTIPAGVRVFSAFVDLYLEVQFRCFPVSHIQVCIYGNVGAEIPGIGGIVLSAGGCFFGGAFFPWLNTSGYLLNFRFGTSNQCASAAPITIPGEGGNQRANVTLDECCESDLEVDVSGRSFPEIPAYSWDFSGASVPIMPITPGGSCNDCGCENVTNVPGHGTSPLQLSAANSPPVTQTGPGQVKFVGSAAAMQNYRIIPENLPPNPTPANLPVPQPGVIYPADGFLVDIHSNCCTMWFKVGNGCSVTIQANATDPSFFTGYYNCSVVGGLFGTPEWRNSNICPVSDNFHNTLIANPFCSTCRPTMPTCNFGRLATYGDNLFENPGYEDGTTAPFTSGVNYGTLTVETNPNHVRSGTASLRHEATGDPGSWSFTAPWNGNNEIDFTVDGEDTYRFTTWVKAAAANTRVRLYLFAKSQYGNTSAPYFIGQAFYVGTDWQQLSLTHIMPPGYKYVTVRVDVQEPGTVWWDDPRLDPVDNLVANPGFESGARSSISVEAQPPLFTGAIRGSVSFDKSTAHKGTSSLLLQASGADCYTLPYTGSSAAGLHEIQSSDDVYRLTVWARADSNTPIQLRIFGLDENYQAIENQRADGTATANWKAFSVDFTPSPESEYISIRLDNDGGKGAAVWWDSMVLERIQ